MSRIFGFCIKHNRRVFDCCPDCEREKGGTLKEEYTDEEDFYDEEGKM
jgi:hypothetical protein